MKVGPGSTAAKHVDEVDPDAFEVVPQIESQPLTEHDRNDEFSSGQQLDGKDEQDADDGEHIPCVFSAELEDEALLAERERAREFLLEIVGEDTSVGRSNNENIRRQATYGWAGVKAPARFDPTAADGGASALLTSEERDDLLQKASEKEQMKVQQGLDDAGFSVAAPGEGADESKADLAQLKGIFGKESGVWFDEENNIGEEDRRGGNHDDIFLAAERRGIDVRTESREQVTFGFFDEASASNAPSTVSTGNFNFSMDSSTDASALEDIKKDGKSTAATRMPFTVSNMFSIAREFSRDDVCTEQELIQRWREERVRGVAGYKRKVQDMKRGAKKRMSNNGGGHEGGTSNSDRVVDAGSSSGSSPQKQINRKRGGRRGQGKR
jgi:hypothetical protein